MKFWETIGKAVGWIVGTMCSVIFILFLIWLIKILINALI